MTALHRFILQFPLIPPIILFGLIHAFIYWMTPTALRSFPVGGITMVILLAFQYNQYRKGNRQPLERMAYGSVIISITMLVLFLISWISGSL